MLFEKELCLDHGSGFLQVSLEIQRTVGNISVRE